MPRPSEMPAWLQSLVSQFGEDWKAGRSPSLDQILPADPARRQLALVPLIVIDLQHRLEARQPARVEDYLQHFPEIESDPDALLSLLETESRVKNSLDPHATSPSVDDQVKRFPMLAERLRPPVDPHQTRPSDRPVKLVGVPSTEAKPRLPAKVGRYRVEKILGQGGFGLVYLAHDDQLLRPVAIKLPHPERIRGPEDVEEYLTEAQTVTSLKHPHIVTVLDVGGTAEHPFFVVSEFIAGSTLDKRIRTNRPSLSETIDLVSTIARTLHFAHKKGIVHRDIKPGNILLDETGKPYVADFGLALREQDVGKRKGIAGTPSYMSPEQARGEAHRVDGRSDLFSLGIVFYQMITRHLPFQGDSVADLLDLVINAEFKPPRQWDENIPKEIERICTKALARRASDRYSSCNDFADDLAEYLKETSGGEKSILEATRPATPPPAGPHPSTPIASPSTQPGSDSQPILRIVPKGLRSFDAHDADFFLDLLPGPRDRHGLPDSIRFWKQRIEEMDADKTFSVGLIYGPSGCGKSSLVKAGLLPRLANSILPVYLEATADETEARLLKGLRKQCPLLPADLDLIEGLKALQRGKYLPANQKVLIVIDQFEQWLHAHKEETNPALVQSLRHCDGRHVQCIVMVRDDFWLAVSRFLRDLEIRLVEGHNSSLVDLFPLPHAEKVLAAFGRAFGMLPEAVSQVTREQKQFLQQALSGLAQEGKVISVRLALFAEMMKGKPWTPAALQAVGGTAGVGVTFLEETFSARSAPPEHRYHQKAAQAVLQALLPESGTDIKGHMRSRDELLSASGYLNRPQDFADLLHILDSEIRLITPTENTDLASGGRQPPDSVTLPNQRYYQLTHDYLVPSLRDWLTRKEKETPQGRARLLLADRAAIWSARPEARQLPSLLQWLQIRRLTVAKAWTLTQQKMMRTATRHHASRILLATSLTLLLGFLCYETYGRLEARQLTNRVLEAPTPEVAGIVKQMAGYRRWVDPLLRVAYNRAEQEGDASKQFKAALALLPDDPALVPYLHDRLLLAKPDEIVVLRQALVPQQADLIAPLWQILENRQNDQNQRLRASCALAEFTPQDPRWKPVLHDVASALVSQEPFEIVDWRDALQPVGADLLPALADFLVDQKRSLSARGLIARIYGTYAAKTTDGYDRLEKVLSGPIPPGAGEDGQRDHTKKLASVGLALLVMNHPSKALALLEHSPNPSVRSYLIEWLAPGGVDYRQLLEHWKQEKNPSVRRALVLSLGQYGPDRLPLVERKNLTPQLLTFYQDDADPGMHGALGWLLRQWGEADSLQAIDQKLATGKREGDRQWLINSQSQTLAVIPKSTPGLMLATMDVTVGQYERFCQETKREYSLPKRLEIHVPTKDCPAISVSWFDAAAYCNWLSKREGIPEDQWCYKRNKDGKYDWGMEIKKGYLKLRGYRLPTELEWESACRAGAGPEASYSFGDPPDLLASYGWYSVNSEGKTHPVGMLKPNDWGLFDMHGNVTQWTQTEYKDKMDKHDGDLGEILQGASDRVVRGGWLSLDAVGCRTAFRRRSTPVNRDNSFGFRLAQVSVAAK